MVVGAAPLSPLTDWTKVLQATAVAATAMERNQKMESSASTCLHRIEMNRNFLASTSKRWSVNKIRSTSLKWNLHWLFIGRSFPVLPLQLVLDNHFSGPGSRESTWSDALWPPPRCLSWQHPRRRLGPWCIRDTHQYLYYILHGFTLLS